MFEVSYYLCAMLRRFATYYKRILALALPVVLAQAGQLTTQFADTAMVGNYGGEDPIPLAAVSLGGSLFLLIYLASLGLALSITPLVGEQYAKGDRREVGRLFDVGKYFLPQLIASAAAMKPSIEYIEPYLAVGEE